MDGVGDKDRIGWKRGIAQSGKGDRIVWKRGIGDKVEEGDRIGRSTEMGWGGGRR